MKKVEMIPEFEIASSISNIIDLNSHDIDLNLSENINCNYYTNEDFSKLPYKENSFNMLTVLNVTLMTYSMSSRTPALILT